MKKILDIGSPLSLELAEINGIPLEQWGRQPADKVSQLMMQSLAGIAYSSDNQKLSKSGVFAAYCAHGLVPVISNPKSSPMDGLFEGKNFLFAQTKTTDINTPFLNTVSRQAVAWYNQHSIKKIGDFFYSHLTTH